MTISTKSRFAVDAMIDLAHRERAGPVALAGICKRLGVSLSFLEQLFAGLRRAGLVHSVRGPGGGYTLGRPAAEISAAEIVAAVEPLQRSVQRPDGRSLCPGLWDDLDGVAMRHLAGVSLAALMLQLPAPEGNAAGPRSSGFDRPAPRVARRLHPGVPNSVFALGRLAMT